MGKSLDKLKSAGSAAKNKAKSYGSSLKNKAKSAASDPFGSLLGSSSSTQLHYVTANRFYVEIESQVTACFSECSGLGMSLETETFSEGGVNDQQRILVKQAKFDNVTLKRGMTYDLMFWDWLNQILDSSSKTSARRNINILVFDQSGQTMQCWTLIGAIPIAWKAPGLQADSTSVAVEELTLAYEGLKITNNTGGGAQVEVKRDKSGYFG